MSAGIQHTHSIFEQPWWLDATAEGKWDAVEIEEGGRVVARLPFVVERRHGLRTLTQPVLTQTLGPWIEHTSGSASERIAREIDLFGKLISRLPRFDIFRQNFHPSVTNWLPFYWQNFRQTTRYSYVIDGLRDVNRLMLSIGRSHRADIRRAAKTITVMESNDLGEVLTMARKTFERQGLTLPYPPDLLLRIDEAAKRYGQRRALYGLDSEGRVHSAAYIVGDSRRAYLLVTGADPELRRSNSGRLVHWRAIQAASEFTDVFDFEGSMIGPIEAFYRGFGSAQTPYFTITKRSPRAERLNSLRGLILG